jgi:hypothetical protein
MGELHRAGGEEGKQVVPFGKKRTGTPTAKKIPLNRGCDRAIAKARRKSKFFCFFFVHKKEMLAVFP